MIVIKKTETTVESHTKKKRDEKTDYYGHSVRNLLDGISTDAAGASQRQHSKDSGQREADADDWRRAGQFVGLNA